MELLLILGIIVIFLLIMGYSFLPVIAAILWLFEGLALLCTVFFAVTAVLILLAKEKEAVFQTLERTERYGEHAVYAISGEEQRNLFPTDAFLKKILYRRKEVSVRVLKIGERHIVFDRVSQVITGVGFFAFLAIALILLDMIR